jgi:hypothetical protein
MANMWDQAIPETDNQQGEYKVLPAGTYDFEVVKATGKEYQPRQGSKIPKCPMIELRLRVEGSDGDVTVFENIYGASSTVWKATQFAKSIGVFTNGMTFGQLLKKAEGCIGKAEVKVEEYNGKKRNRIDKFVETALPEITNDDLPF